MPVIDWLKYKKYYAFIDCYYFVLHLAIERVFGK